MRPGSEMSAHTTTKLLKVKPHKTQVSQQHVYTYAFFAVAVKTNYWDSIQGKKRQSYPFNRLWRPIGL
jgi:hypothetical protein